MVEDTSIEFDMFEEVRRNLVEALVGEGYDTLEAQRIALYVVQGVREVPKLMSALAKGSGPHSRRQILDSLHTVLDNALALDKARACFTGLKIRSCTESRKNASSGSMACMLPG